MLRLASAAITLLAAAGLAACDVPRDSGGTLDRIRGGTMRVGVVVHPPWVTDSAGVVGGVEPSLVAGLARGLNARVAWVRAPEAQLLTALHAREVDLVVGGLTADLPWKSEVAFTRPYHTDTVVVGVPPGTRLTRIDGQVVSVEDGSPVAAEVRKKKGRPVSVPDLARASGAVAAPTWRLARLGRSSSGVVLREEKHVMAVSPGENGWLMRVERMLRESESRVPDLVRQASW
jgi:polar amino acid transport system substrate-binding protein